jgi:hypothetical protein
VCVCVCVLHFIENLRRNANMIFMSSQIFSFKYQGLSTEIADYIVGAIFLVMCYPSMNKL